MCVVYPIVKDFCKQKTEQESKLLLSPKLPQEKTLQQSLETNPQNQGHAIPTTK